MGCLQSSSTGKESSRGRAGNGAEPLPTSEPKQVDGRLPFDNYRQLFTLKNSWKAVARSMDGTAKDCLLRFFHAHPEHLALHKDLAKMAEADMKESTAFEEAALFLFNTVDEVMACVDGKVDMAIALLKNAGQNYYKTNIKGFQPQYLKDMEQPFLDSIRETLGDRFNEGTDQNFRRLFEFVLTHILS